MSREKLKGTWSQLLAWGALVLGFGALLQQDARADRSQDHPFRVTPESQSLKRLASRSDEVAVRLDGENIYLSHDGSTFEELRLGNTPEAAHLRKLLRDAGAVGQLISVPIGPIVVASGGGSGKGEKPKSSKPTGEHGKGK